MQRNYPLFSLQVKMKRNRYIEFGVEIQLQNYDQVSQLGVIYLVTL